MTSRTSIQMNTLKQSGKSMRYKTTGECTYYIRCPITNQALYVDEKNKIRTVACERMGFSNDYLWSFQFLPNGVNIIHSKTKEFLTRSTFHVCIMPAMNRTLVVESQNDPNIEDGTKKTKKEERDVKIVDDSRQKWDITLLANGVCTIRSYDNNCYLSMDETSVKVKSTSLVPKTGSLFELIPSEVIKDREHVDFSVIKKDFFEISFRDLLEEVLKDQYENGCEESYENVASMEKKMAKIEMRPSDDTRQARLVRLTIARMRSKINRVYTIGFTESDKKWYMVQQNII